MSSITGYVLAAYHRRSKESGEAALKYYLLGALTNALMLIGVVLLFGLGATTTYPELSRILPAADPLGVLAGTGLLLLGVAFKVGAVPAHPWVPDVAEGDLRRRPRSCSPRPRSAASSPSPASPRCSARRPSAGSAPYRLPALPSSD